MPYSDEDILDLYNTLTDVGLGEDPKSGADRLRIAFLEEIGPKKFYHPKAWEEFLTAKRVSHTFGFLLSYGEGRVENFRIFTIIRDHAILKGSVVPFDEVYRWIVADSGTTRKMEMGLTLDQIREKVASFQAKFSGALGLRNIRIKGEDLED